jgi:hypothetical protein
MPRQRPLKTNAYRRGIRGLELAVRLAGEQIRADMREAARAAVGEEHLGPIAAGPKQSLFDEDAVQGAETAQIDARLPQQHADFTPRARRLDRLSRQRGGREDEG